MLVVFGIYMTYNICTIRKVNYIDMERIEFIVLLNEV